MPDYLGPPAFPYFPCLIAAPQQCFRESASALLHDGQINDTHRVPKGLAYKDMDPTVHKVFPADQRMSPYTGDCGRPSYKQLGEKGMKEEVSKMRPFLGLRGCNWFTEKATFPVDMW